MVSERDSSPGNSSNGMRRLADRIKIVLGPALATLRSALKFVTSSFFRFVIFLGVVFLAVGTFAVEGHLSGHFGIYGITLIAMGAVGRLIIHWKVKDRA